jgi:maleylpyruvate isomerase
MSAEVVPADVPARLQALEAASDRLLATVEGLTPGGFAEPSVLPDWTRAHVVAHLALNAEGLAAALSGLAAGEHRPIYASDEARDTDIDALAATDPELVRVRLHTAVVAFADAVRGVPTESWSGTVERLPDGPRLPALETLLMRHREVEIHHADLDAGYAHADWPAPFVGDLLDVVVRDQAGSGPFTAAATDLGRTWSVGEGDGPEVRGTGSALGWWLVGRGSGEGVTSDAGTLPELAPWRRTPRRS